MQGTWPDSIRQFFNIHINECRTAERVFTDHIFSSFLPYWTLRFFFRFKLLLSLLFLFSSAISLCSRFSLHLFSLPLRTPHAEGTAMQYLIDFLERIQFIHSQHSIFAMVDVTCTRVQRTHYTGIQNQKHRVRSSERPPTLGWIVCRFPCHVRKNAHIHPQNDRYHVRWRNVLFLSAN